MLNSPKLRPLLIVVVQEFLPLFVSHNFPELGPENFFTTEMPVVATVPDGCVKAISPASIPMSAFIPEAVHPPARTEAKSYPAVATLSAGCKHKSN
jgi:hypothetical protein